MPEKIENIARRVDNSDEDDISVGVQSLAGRRAWIISDGIAGHLAITSGIADALALDIQIKPVQPRALWRHLAPNGPADPGIMRALLNNTLPDIAFGAGRQTVPVIRALKRLGVFTVIFQSPRALRESADLIWAPAHDALSGQNVITTLTPPHRFTAQRLAALRGDLPATIIYLPQPRVTLLLGGPGAGYRYTPETIAEFSAKLTMTGNWDGSFLITPSRRTPPDLLEAADLATSHRPRILWSGEGENPYASFLAAGDAFIVTADSVNMTGEACATGNPVYVFTPAGGRQKFRRFHQALQDHGAARPLSEAGSTYTPWHYEPLIATDVVATEIEERWALRCRQTVGNRR